MFNCLARNWKFLNSDLQFFDKVIFKITDGSTSSAVCHLEAGVGHQKAVRLSKGGHQIFPAKNVPCVFTQMLFSWFKTNPFFSVS
jgi:hypothetical protein